MRPLVVVNPYAPALRFPTSSTRTRRDHEKYLALIDAMALVHQHQRRSGDDGLGGWRAVVEYIEVTLEDIEIGEPPGARGPGPHAR